jgi:hypothetical protein
MASRPSATDDHAAGSADCLETGVERFLWSERRKGGKTALVRMHGNACQVGAWLAGRTVELLFSPFDLDRVEVRLGGKPAGAAVPFTVGRHRHPKARLPRRRDAEAGRTQVAGAHVEEQPIGH